MKKKWNVTGKKFNPPPRAAQMCGADLATRTICHGQYFRCRCASRLARVKSDASDVKAQVDGAYFLQICSRLVTEFVLSKAFITDIISHYLSLRDSKKENHVFF